MQHQIITRNTENGLEAETELFICDTTQGKRAFQVTSYFSENMALTSIRAILRVCAGSEIHGAYMPGIISGENVSVNQTALIAYHTEALKLLRNQVKNAKKLYQNE